MSAQIILFVPKPNPNRDVLDRLHGVPMHNGTVETDADPRNPNVRPEYAAPENDPA